MEALKNAVGMGGDGDEQKRAKQPSQGGLGGIGDKLNTAAGGGTPAGKNEGMDLRDAFGRTMLKCHTIAVSGTTQDHGLGQSQNPAHAAVDQADNEQISEFLRSQCRSNTGKDLLAAERDAAQADGEARQT